MVQNEKGMSASEKAERSAMPVMMPGSAMGRMTSSEMVSRPKKRVRLTAAAQSVPRTSAMTVEMVATLTDRVSACPDVRPVPGDGEPLQRQAGRRELVALFLGREGIEEDQEDRQVQEGEAADGGDLQAERGGGGAVRAHRRLPCVWRTQR